MNNVAACAHAAQRHQRPLAPLPIRRERALVLDKVDLAYHAGRDRRPHWSVGLRQVVACCTPPACWNAPAAATCSIEGRLRLGVERRTAHRHPPQPHRLRLPFHHLLPEFDAIHNVALPALIAGRPQARSAGGSRALLGVMGLGSIACVTSRRSSRAASSSASRSRAP